MDVKRCGNNGNSFTFFQMRTVERSWRISSWFHPNVIWRFRES